VIQAHCPAETPWWMVLTAGKVEADQAVFVAKIDALLGEQGPAQQG
jgi:hypothetical protein